MLSGGAVGLGLVIGWAGGFAGGRRAALAYRIAAGGAALLSMLALTGPGSIAAGALALALGTAGHESFVTALRNGRHA